MNNLGNIVKILRKLHKLTQEEFADKVGCSKKTIYRIEKNEVSISPFQLQAFNIFFNLNIEDFVSLINKYNDYETYQNYMLLRNSIFSGDQNLIKKYYTMFCDLDGFQKNEPKFLIFNAKLLLDIENKKDNNIIINEIFEFLNYESFNHLLHDIESDILPEYCFSILNILTVLYDYNDEFRKSYKLSKKLYEYFNRMISLENISPHKYDYILVRKFLAYSTNYADNLFINKEFEKCSEILDKSINILQIFECTHSAQYIYALKCSVSYELSDIKTSKKYKCLLIAICTLRDYNDFLEKKLNELQYKYPTLFEH